MIFVIFAIIKKTVLRRLPSSVVWMHCVIILLYAVMAGLLVLTICYLNLKPTEGFLARFGQAAMEEHILTGYDAMYNTGRMLGRLFFPCLLLVFVQRALLKKWKILFYIWLSFFILFSVSYLLTFVLAIAILVLSFLAGSREWFGWPKPVAEYDSLGGDVGDNVW